MTVSSPSTNLESEKGVIPVKKIFIAVFAALLALQGAAYAENITGKVVSVNAGEKSIAIERAGADAAQPETLNISVAPETKFVGVASLEELKGGEAVSIEAEKDAASGRYSATSVSASGSTQPSASSAVNVTA